MFPRTGVTITWCFRTPGTFSDAVARGSFHRWYSIVTDPRYMHQQVKRNSPIHKRHNGGNGSSAPANQADSLSRDWSASLGGAGVAPDMYPAKCQGVGYVLPSLRDLGETHLTCCLRQEMRVVVAETPHQGATRLSVCTGCGEDTFSTPRCDIFPRPVLNGL